MDISPNRVAIYCRVSSTSQNDDMQAKELAEFCQRAGWVVVDTYRETISGTLSVSARPELTRLMLDAKRRRFNKVVVWSADRLGRSMSHLMVTLSELHDCKVDVFSFQQGVDTSTPMGSMLWKFLGIFAEFENQIRRERQAAGIARARQNGVKLGRPKVSAARQQEIQRLRAAGLGINKIARMTSTGVGTVAKLVDNTRTNDLALPSHKVGLRHPKWFCANPKDRC